MTPDMFKSLAAIFKALGFLYVTVDVEGYRQGSLNAALRERA
jgi:PP-loop superfamily ATP-utilizing enzyme